jgi:hypothetical protein
VAAEDAGMPNQTTEEETMMVIDIDACGTVQAMHRENVLPLGFLGDQKIERATDIRFDESAQTWGIWPRATPAALEAAALYLDTLPGDDFLPPPSEYAKGFATYEGARDVEIKWLEQARLVGVEPTSDSGLLVLEFVRTSGKGS